MKKILSVLLACMMLMSLTSCDLESIVGELAEQNKQIERNESTDEQNEDENISGNETSELSWDELELPEDFPKLSETVSSFEINSSGFYSFKWENTDYESSEAKVNMMCDWANGKITGSTVEKNTTWKIQNDRVNLTAAYSGDDKLFFLTTSVSEAKGLSAYIAVHSFTEDDFKPAGFTSYGELKTSGQDVGGITQNGAFDIHIEDGSYKKEDAVAWCDAIIKKLVEISAANDNKVKDLRGNFITSYEEYAEKDGGIPDYPSIGCYFASELGNGKDYTVQIIAGYNASDGVYRVQFTTLSRIY